MADFLTPTDSGYPSPREVNIQFEHIATENKVEFFAWITNFSDTYTSDWNSQTLYGRMDPMVTFKNTSRKITLEWDVVAASLEEAKINMAKISRFIQMQYPTYVEGGGTKGGHKKDGGASMIGSPPLIRAKFMNWMGSMLDGKGLICALGGVTFKPNLEHGTFGYDGGLYPQSFALSIDMMVLHEHFLGYSNKAGGVFGGSGTGLPGFPYAADTLTELAQEAEAMEEPVPVDGEEGMEDGVDTGGEAAAGEGATTAPADGTGAPAETPDPQTPPTEESCAAMGRELRHGVCRSKQ